MNDVGVGENAVQWWVAEDPYLTVVTTYGMLITLSPLSPLSPRM